mgnify:CR=1 FL=1
MFPLLILPKLLGALTSMTKSTGSLAEGAAKSASDANEVASEVMKNAVLQNVSDSTPNKESGDKETAEDTTEMFGGLDLANVKSALDDTGPMGPPEQVKGGVYKQIFEVNKLMLGSLQRMEQTMKMLLAIEFERIQGMQQTDSKILIDDQETPEKEKKKRGLLGAAASGVGGMLGGAFSKAKGGLSGNFGKFIGLGAIILLFKKFEDDIKLVTGDILKYFKSVYDIFKSEGLDAAFDKVGDDLKNVFLPRFKDMILDFMDMMFNVIHEAVFGPSGDKAIQLAATDSGPTSATQTNLESFAATTDIEGMNYSRELGFGKPGKNLQDENPKVYADLKSKFRDMEKISFESGGRIQWNTFPGIRMDQQDGLLKEVFATFDVASIINARPVIDGALGTWDMLKGIDLKQMAGITRMMSDDKAEKITDVLRRKTQAYQDNFRVGSPEMMALDAEYRALDPVIFKSRSRISSKDISTSGVSYGTAGLKSVGTDFSSGASINFMPSKSDNSIINNNNLPTNNYLGLGAGNTYSSSQLNSFLNNDF